MKKIALLLVAIFTVFTVSAQLPTGQFLGPNQTVCPGGAGLGFNGSEPGFNPAWTFQWSTGETTQQIFYPYPNAGTYAVWCKVSLGGNSVTDTVVYTVHPAVTTPSLTSTASSACVDSTTVSTPYAAGMTYQWSKADLANPGNYIVIPGQTSNSIVVTVSGEYRIKVTNAGGCFEYNTLMVSTLGKPKKYLHDTAYCQTTGAPMIVMADNKNVNCTYLWNQGNTGNEWVINPNSYQPTPTTYWVTITNANGCQTVDSVTWVAHPKPTPQLNSGIYTNGNNVTLRDLKTEYDHIWKYGNTVISTADSVIVNYAGSFTVITTNQYGCSVTNTVTVLYRANPGTNPADTSGTDTTGTNPPTSINDIETEAGFITYPNPTRDNVTLMVAQGIIKSVIVTDMTGRIVYTNVINHEKSIVNLSSITNGLYLIKATVKTSKSEGTITRKINKL